MQKMRTKNTVKNSFIMFAISILIAVPFRCWQFTTIIEPHTGFYNEINFGVYFLNTALIFFCVFFILMYALSKKDLVYMNEGKKSTAMSLASFMLALTLLIASFSSFKSAALTLSNPSLAIYDSMIGNLIRTPAGSAVLEAISACVSCFYFILLGIDNCKGSSLAKANKIIALFPVLWSIFRLMHRFMRTVNYLNVSDLLYEMVMCVFLMFFFMAFAQVNSRVNDEGIAWKLGAFGLPAALMSLLCSLSRFFVAITGNAELLADQSPIEWCDIAVAALIIASLLSFLVSKNDLKGIGKSENSEHEAEENAQES